MVQLPEGASLERTDEVIKQATEIALETPGVKDAVAFAGFSGATFTNASNQGVIFTPLKVSKNAARRACRRGNCGIAFRADAGDP